MYISDNLKILEFTDEEYDFLKYLLETPEKKSSFIVDGTYPCWVPADDVHGAIISDDNDVNSLLRKGLLILDSRYHDEKENEWYVTVSINKDKLEVIENYFKIELFLSDIRSHLADTKLVIGTEDLDVVLRIRGGKWVDDICGVILKMINVGFYIY